MTAALVGDVLTWTAVAFLLLGVATLYRAYRGPTVQDRVIAVNVAGTNAVVVIVLLAVVTGHADVLDVAIVYALLNFVLSIAVARFYDRGWS